MFEKYDDILTVNEVMEVMKIGKNLAYEMLKRGDIKAIRIKNCWRIPKTSLINYIEEQTSINKS